ncbi:zinc transporter ZIP9-like [Sycon ciliatum]|uniref:zinc transporter ZIP9-like n=1 Tax=Sycon ciliatum TaxID=27933 RepID=UPI0031F6CD4A|eukprot:scpid7122/ scgid20171/ Zinc transporter ZIP9; Solute carrier family 39 member 9; Zrt- and Irt-like protein 9
METIIRLLLLSATMFIGSFLAGLMPLAMTLSEANMRAMTTTGAGLLVGTALAVIIPEGIHTLYDSALSHKHTHEPVTSSSLLAGAEQIAKRSLSSLQDQAVAVAAGDAVGAVDGSKGKVGDSIMANVLSSQTAAGVAHTHEHSPVESAHAYIGPMLVLGFVCMLLIDQCSGGHSHGGPTSPTDGDAQATRHKPNTTLIGLVVHAAADGIALGAAATNRLDVEIMIFLAIMLHKAPAAFGLTSFLLHEGFDKVRIRHSLMVFSLAAPIAALITYLGLSRQSKEALADVDATGLGMLFSAGTFLYVATMHVLPGISKAPVSSTTSASAELGSSSSASSHSQKMNRSQLALLVFGIFLPLVLSYGHHH